MKQTIGDFLAMLRRANGYTQQDIADKLSVSNKTLSNWECNKVLPDILLLPALAELYGVTVDEILAGERQEKSEVTLSSNSEKKILKNKLAKFSMQSWILLGIIISGIILTAICVAIEIIKVSWVGFPWWRLLLVVGAIPVVVCLAILFAFWKGAEMSVDDTSDCYYAYCLLLRKKFANSLYVVSLSSVFAAGIVVIVLLVRRVSAPVSFVKACLAFAIFAIVLFAIGWLFYKSALTKFGGESARQAIAKDRRFFWAVGFWGAIPLALAIILAVVLSCVTFTKQTTIYQNSSAEEFVEHMETFVGNGVEKHFPLSELAKTAKPGDEFDLGDGYVAVYNVFSFTITNELISIYKLESDGEWHMYPFSIDVVRYFLATIDETSSNVTYFFNVRYHSSPFGNNAKSPYEKYNGYTVDEVGDGLTYVHKIVHDYSALGYMISFPVIAADLFVCLTLCVLKRNKHTVRL